MRRKGRKGGRYYVCPINGWQCWAYSETEAKQLLKTSHVMLRTGYQKQMKLNAELQKKWKCALRMVVK